MPPSTAPAGVLLPDAVRRRLRDGSVSALVSGLTWTVDGVGVMRARLPGAQAEQAWWELRALVGATGRSPVVLGDPDRQGYEQDVDPAADIAAADHVDLDRWLAERAKREELWTTPIDLVAARRTPVGETHEFWAVHDSLSGQFLPVVLIALLPTPRSSEAAAYLQFGFWNDCPEPPVHVAMYRRWEQRWGAEVFAVTADQVNFFVPRPPQTYRDAAVVTQEQFVFDADIVLQSTETCEVLTGEIIRHQSWQLWWD